MLFCVSIWKFNARTTSLLGVTEYNATSRSEIKLYKLFNGIVKLVALCVPETSDNIDFTKIKDVRLYCTFKKEIADKYCDSDLIIYITTLVY